VTTITPVITALAALQYDNTTWDTAEYAAAGSAVSNPVTWTPINSPGSLTPGADQGPSTFIQFGGRSSTGKRAKFYLFETFFQASATMRVLYGAVSIVDDVIDALVAASLTGEPLCVVDMSTIVPYQYANLGQNDYLTHQAR